MPKSIMASEAPGPFHLFGLPRPSRYGFQASLTLCVERSLAEVRTLSADPRAESEVTLTVGLEDLRVSLALESFMCE